MKGSRRALTYVSLGFYDVESLQQAGFRDENFLLRFFNGMSQLMSFSFQTVCMVSRSDDIPLS